VLVVAFTDDSGVGFVVAFTDDLGNHSRGDVLKLLVSVAGKRWKQGDPWW
jgi:hypothetical protein